MHFMQISQDVGESSGHQQLFGNQQRQHKEGSLYQLASRDKEKEWHAYCESQVQLRDFEALPRRLQYKLQLMQLLKDHQALLANILSADSQKLLLIQQFKTEIIAFKRADFKAVASSAIDDQLLLSISNSSQPQHKYRLQLSEAIPLYLIKGRKFDLKVRLTDLSGQLASNPKKLLLDLQVFSSSDFTRPLLQGISNKPLYNYDPSSYLLEGTGILRKIQINEVSSKFKQGVVFLRVSAEDWPSPKPSDEFCSETIMPLLINNLPVKAKHAQPVKSVSE